MVVVKKQQKMRGKSRGIAWFPQEYERNRQRATVIAIIAENAKIGN